MDICIFGDSITWGAFDPEGGGRANRLRNHLEPDGHMVYNCGVSGDSTEDLLFRFKTEATAREPELIVFAIGTNDSQYIHSKDNPRTTLEQFEKNLEELIKQSKDFTEKILFVGLTEVEEEKVMPIPWSNKNIFYDNENFKQYDGIIKKVCVESKLPYVEVSDLLQRGELSDGLHPNSKGHEKLFKAIKDKLEELQLLKGS